MKRLSHTLIPYSLRRKVALLRSAGDKVECPCCGSRFAHFWTSGEAAHTRRENSFCPTCLSMERHRLLWLYLKANPHLYARPLRLLHIAPETLFTRLFQRFPKVEYVSADLESPLAMLKMDITRIPFPENSFDAIFCCHVLEHIPDDRRAMQEMHRILKPNGWAILQSPMENSRAVTYEDWSVTDPVEREKHFNQRDHVRIYGRDYKTRLQNAGFYVCVEPFAREMPEAQRERFRVDADEDIYLCWKEKPD